MKGKKNLTFKQFMGKESVAGVVFCSPFIIGFLMFMIVPMGISLYYSFCDYNILTPAVFSGAKNYIKMFTDDEVWRKSIQVTFYFALVSVPLRLIFALIVAMLLLKTTKATGFYRAAYYLPSIIGGSVAVAVLWKRIWATNGVINTLLNTIGIKTSFAWLGNTKTAIWMLIILAVWQFGSSMLIFLSSLKQIPTSLYEAAMVDGANPVSRFFKITLPLLMPILLYVAITSLIGGLQMFDVPQIITAGSGSPNNSCMTLIMYLNRLIGSGSKNYGMGGAVSVVIFILTGALSMIVFKTMVTRDDKPKKKAKKVKEAVKNG